MNDTFEVIAGDVLVRDRRIAAVGAVPPTEGVDRVIEAHGAFLLPGLNRLLANPRRAPRALVLTPPRERAAQIVEATQDFARHSDPKTTRRYDRDSGQLDRSPAYALAGLLGGQS